MTAHDGHVLVEVSTSWGGKTQCETCRTVVAAYSGDGSEPLPYIPAGVGYVPPESP